MVASNIIILTNGLSGSSVVTGFIAQAGFWTGDNTFKKRDYNTYENQELININKTILEAIKFTEDYELEFKPEYFTHIDNNKAAVDPKLFEDFIKQCNENSPWIWKDPRLWLTIRLWLDHLPLENIKFIVLSRELLQTWISITCRKHIQTYEYTKEYIDGTISSICTVLDENNITYLKLVYEDLITDPKNTIETINTYLGTNLTIDDLSKVYTKPLYKKHRGLKDFIKATLIYMKNYNHRYK